MGVGSYLISSEETARREPNRVWAMIPRTSNPRDGWKDITYYQVANSVNHVARKVAESSGYAPKEFPTIAYLGPNDVRYLIFMLAASKAGYKVRRSEFLGEG